MTFTTFTRRAALGALAGAAALATVATTASADTVRLRFHTFYGTEIDPIAKKFRDAVKDASNGTLRIQYFRGGELVASDQFADAVAKGTVDIVHGTGGYWSGQIDVGNIEAGLPGAWATVEEAKGLFESAEVDALLTEAYAEAGTVYLGKGYGHNYDLLTKEPVTSLEDLKTRKIRATSNVAKVLSAFDIPTVYLPAQELYIGMSTGVIDGAIYGGPVEYEQLKLHETAQNYTFMNMLMPGWTETFLANPDSWNKLSDEHKDILKTAIQQFADDIHQWLADGNEGVAEGTFQYATLPDADSKALTQAAQGVWQEEAARSPRNQKFIDALVANAKAQGRL
ncbi:TRAP transporter substrate-binding protein DctP [Aliiroseovarius crassostreae]|uniref:TRAP transporter substrate-binding protein DctP n=1 Tax=Aliiroseovarius crassostreae TaxID=154981 RepID=UPI0021AFC0D5|nr:TRAP transporter substrate-binding protein DctP [Aliiroseovarius crassostreae]UWQ07286.1 TRAP transporter substrate-binding protein DctP [Aliiroseovarius crassostreae]